jgi:hypothetical protein
VINTVSNARRYDTPPYEPKIYLAPISMEQSKFDEFIKEWNGLHKWNGYIISTEGVEFHKLDTTNLDNE